MDVKAVLSPSDPAGDVPSLTKWIIGDMLWARVTGHPWWPCMVGLDPSQTMYTRIVKRESPSGLTVV